MWRVFIGVGHGGKDPGAVGRVKEADANLTIALEVQRILEMYGVTVGISRRRDEDDTLTEEVREANAFIPDLAVEVHNNAGGGDGWEAYVQTNGFSTHSNAAAKAIEARVMALGQKSRGIKVKKNGAGTADYFGWLRDVKAPAVLLEGFFVDSADADDFDTEDKQRELGRAYAYGILDYFGIGINTTDVKEEENMSRYNTVEEIGKNADFALPTVMKLIGMGVLRGSGTVVDKNGLPADMDLSRDMLRLMVFTDRAGGYDK